MSVFFTDQIIHISVTTDKYGVKTEGTPTTINARVEDFNDLITDNRGQEVFPEMLIFCDTDKDIKYGDKVIVLTKGGEEYNQPDKIWLVHKCPLIHGFSKHHKEIYI